MRLDEVLDWKAPEAKKKKLDAFLTPAVVAKHHDQIVNIIGKKLSNTEIDELNGEINNTIPSKDEVQFQLKMIKRAFDAKKLDRTEIGTSGNGSQYVLGVLILSAKSAHSEEYTKHTSWVNIEFRRLYWFASAGHEPGAFDNPFYDKKFKSAREALEYALKYVDQAREQHPPELIGKPTK